MTPDVPIAAIRDAIGESAVLRLTGLDRRTLGRIMSGQATLHVDTAAVLRENLRSVARLAGAHAPADGQAIRGIRSIASMSPRAAAPYYKTAAALIEAGNWVSMRDLCVAVGGDPNASAPNSAARSLAAAGLVVIEDDPADRQRRAKRVMWVAR